MRNSLVLIITTFILWNGCALADSSTDMYNQGVALFKNNEYSKAVHYFDLSATQGNKLAQGMLCSIYNYGTGVEKNYRTAAYWCEKSAKQGDAMAQYDLGNMYIKGEGVSKDYNRAIYWLMNSARSGHPPSYFNLGVLYYKGEGVSKSSVEAYKWFSLANASGIADAKKWIGLLEKTMNGGEINQANTLAKEWYGQVKK